MSKGPRQMTPADRRRVTFAAAGIHDPRLVIIEQDPLRDDETGELLPVVVDDEHRGLLHLDGKGEVRPPKAWENENAHDRYWQFAGDRADLTDELHAERAALRLPERLALAMTRIGSLQAPRARQRRETDAKGADSNHAPQGEGIGAVAHAHKDEVERRLLQIRLHTEALEDLYDVHCGFAHLSYAMMDSDAKDALLTGPKLRGLSPEEITALHPELGAPRTIRWVRSKAGQGHRGFPKDESKIRRKPETA